MDTRDLKEPLKLEPLPLATARDVIGEWEMRWWEAVHTSTVTADEDREHGDLTDPSQVVRVATQWCGRNFNPRMVGFFAMNLTGLRLSLDRLVAEQYRQLEDRVGVLEAMVRGAMDSAGEGCADAESRVAALEARAERIAELLSPNG